MHEPLYRGITFKKTQYGVFFLSAILYCESWQNKFSNVQIARKLHNIFGVNKSNADGKQISQLKQKMQITEASIGNVLQKGCS